LILAGSLKDTDGPPGRDNLVKTIQCMAPVVVNTQTNERKG
jgi:hypothetical protein